MSVTQFDLQIMAMTLYGEGRGEPLEGICAIAHVILNRWKANHRGAKNIDEVCLEPYQFSAWNVKDVNRPKMEMATLSDPYYRRCMYVACGAVEGYIPDRTEGARHYHSNKISPPSWARGHKPIASLGSHLFYSGIR